MFVTIEQSASEAEYESLLKDENGRSALQAARESDELTTISKLVESEINMCEGGDRVLSNRSLTVAAESGDLRVVNLLLEAGDDFSGITSIFSPSALEVSAGAGHFDVVERLLNAERDITTAEGYFSLSALQTAVENGQHEEVVRLRKNQETLNRIKDHKGIALSAGAGQADLRIVKALVNAGADVNSTESARQPAAITAAARAGYLDIVDYLLQNGANCTEIQKYDAKTPLRAAAEGGHIQVIERLMAAGADVNMDKALHEASRHGYIDIVQRLLDAGALVDADKKKHVHQDTPGPPRLAEGALTALQCAAKGGHLEIVELLLHNGADVNVAPSDYGRTALQAAAERGSIEIVHVLLAAGADVNAPVFIGGITELQAAAKSGSLDIIDTLLDSGAKVETELGNGGRFRPLLWLRKKALNYATGKGHGDVVRHLLELGTPAIQDKEYYDTLLNSASKIGDFELLKMLVEAKADLEAVAYKGSQTALQCAVAAERLDMVELLLGAGANANSGEGLAKSALHVASEKGNYALVGILLSAGADVNAMDSNGMTALQAAEKHGSEEVMRLLLTRQTEVADISTTREEMEDALEVPEFTKDNHLCSTCAPLLFDVFSVSGAPKSIDWHPSLTSLDISVKNGCPFCIFFKKQLGYQEIPLPQTSRIRFNHYPNDSRGLWSEITEPYPKNIECPQIISTRIQFNFEPFEGKRKPIPGSTSSPETFAQIRSWLTCCDSGHEKCRSYFTKRFLPSRLIDVGISKEQDTVRLVNTNLLEEVRYIALSHCRGEQPTESGITTKASLELHSTSIQTNNLPLTFVHAIEVAKKLDIQYLWIDSLCIIRDSKEDLERESPLINKIYMNAYCTIAASGSASDTEGLFRTIEKTDDLSVEFKCTSPKKGITKKVLVIKAQSSWMDQYENGSLSQRAWALQERELSPRVLHYTGSTSPQVLWECRTFKAMESWPTDNMPIEYPGVTPRILDSLLDLGKQNVLNLWHDAIANYSTRFTKEATGIFEVMGYLASVMKPKVEGEYIAGMWEKDLRRSLAWAPKYDYGRPAKRHSKYVAPTWSWASVDKPTWFIIFWRYNNPELAYVLHEEGALQIRSHKLVLSPSSKDQFGPLLPSELYISARIIYGVLGYNASSDCFGRIIELEDISGTERYGQMWFDVPEEMEGLKVVSCIYLVEQKCLDHGHAQRGSGGHELGLAIVPVEGRKGVYRRVGLIDGISLKHFLNKEVVDITLI